MAASFTRNLTKAPRDGRSLIMLVPTGNPHSPFAFEISWWDGKRWEGDWRYDNQPGNWRRSEPIAWADQIPTMSARLISEFMRFKPKKISEAKLRKAA